MEPKILKRFSKSEVKRFEFHIPLIEKELETDRHPAAIIHGYGFTFIEDILRLREYAEFTGHVKVVKAIDRMKT